MERDAARDRDLLAEAAEAAGRIALSHFGEAPENWDKDDGSGPVTAADLEINAMLRDRLLGARPDYGWLSEEDPDDAARLRCDRVFIVDPIDGTRAFIAGEQGFSIALAVAENGWLLAAAVHLPARAETFAAARGHGATCNNAPIHASARNRIDGATVLAASVQMRSVHWPGGKPPLDRHFRSSLAWRLCLVAQGRFDSMVTFRRSFEWDIAAGALIAAEAGAVVTDGTGEAMRFNSADGMQAGVVAAPKGLHRQIMTCRQPQAATAPLAQREP